MVDLADLQFKNEQRWKTATIVRPQQFAGIAKRLVENKARYLEVVRRCRALGSNMPDDAWVFVGCTHYRESDCDFDTNLGQGDSLYRKSVHVPAGRGPFAPPNPDGFERGAVDALVYCAPYAAMRNKDWSISGILTYEERYNGLAYANVGAPSPYVWSGTSAYTSGKVLVDHGPIVWSVVDQQAGVAGIILAIVEIDPETKFADMPMPAVTPDSSDDLAPTPGTHDAVWVQWALNHLGATPKLAQDGIIGAATRTAVKAFQATHGLVVDGVAGAQTISAMIIQMASTGTGP
jgi:lysozyme family protein